MQSADEERAEGWERKGGRGTQVTGGAGVVPIPSPRPVGKGGEGPGPEGPEGPSASGAGDLAVGAAMGSVT
jgi:hypothetical protein